MWQSTGGSKQAREMPTSWTAPLHNAQQPYLLAISSHCQWATPQATQSDRNSQTKSGKVWHLVWQHHRQRQFAMDHAHMQPTPSRPPLEVRSVEAAFACFAASQPAPGHLASDAATQAAASPSEAYDDCAVGLDRHGFKCAFAALVGTKPSRVRHTHADMRALHAG